jgi:hypothetical protein
MGQRFPETVKKLDALRAFLTPDNPVSVRYCMYRLLSLKLIESTKAINTVTELTRTARVSGELDDDCFVDNRRVTITRGGFDGISDGLRWLAHHQYNLKYWEAQPELEKDTTSFIVADTCWEYGVPLRKSTGYYSRPFLCTAAREIDAYDYEKHITICYIGDFDPSGLDIERAAREGNGLAGNYRKEGLFDILVSKHGWTREEFDKRITWKRIGATEQDMLTLPDEARVSIKEDEYDENENKIKKGDSRSPEYKERYGEYGVEVEAVEVYEPGELVRRLKVEIDAVLDTDLWDSRERKEKNDKRALLGIADEWVRLVEKPEPKQLQENNEPLPKEEDENL